MKITIISSQDGNESYEIEGNSYDDCLENAITFLGFLVCENEEEIEED